MCPETKVIGRECRLITRAEVETLARKQSVQAIAAEGVLKAREILSELGDKISDDIRVRLLGRLDSNVARVLLNKQQRSAILFKSVEAVGATFVSELMQAMGGEGLANRWAGQDGQNQASASASVQASSVCLDDAMQTFTDSGQLVPIDVAKCLKERGFEVGFEVAEKANKQVKHIIVQIGQTIDLINCGSAETVCVPVKEFLLKWKVFGEENYPFEMANHAPSNELFKTNAMKGKITMALQALSEHYSKPSVRMQMKPAKKVFAERNYKAGSCVLVPETGSIVEITGTDQKVSSKAIEVITKKSIFRSAKYYLMPPSMSTDASKSSLNAPFWIVRATEDPQEANMVWDKIKAECSVKVQQAKQPSEDFIFAVLKNKSALNIGDELVVLNTDTDEGEQSQPKAEAEGKAMGGSTGKASAGVTSIGDEGEQAQGKAKAKGKAMGGSKRKASAR